MRLGDICTIVSGSTPKSNIPEYWDGDIKWITPAELTEDSYFINDSVRHITELGVAKTGLKPFPKGTVILSSRAPIGKTAIAGCEMYCNQGFKNLICSDKINPRYLYWFLTCNTDYLNSLGRGATFKEISKEIVADIEIPLPALDEQIAIAKKFEKISELIALRKEQLAKLDQLVKSRFIELVCENTTTSIKLMNVVEDERIITYGIVKPGEHTVGGVPIIKVKDFPKGVILMDDMLLASRDIESKYKRSRVKEGDLLFSIRGSVGRTAFVPKDLVDANITQDTARISVSKQYNPHYVRTALEYEPVLQNINEHVRGVAVKGISLAELREIEIPVVEKALQDSFGCFVERTDKSKLAIQQSLAKLELLKKTLMQEYFG